MPGLHTLHTLQLELHLSEHAQNLCGPTEFEGKMAEFYVMGSNFLICHPSNTVIERIFTRKQNTGSHYRKTPFTTYQLFTNNIRPSQKVTVSNIAPKHCTIFEVIRESTDSSKCRFGSCKKMARK